MTQAQENLSAYRKAMGAHANPRPRDVHTPEGMNAQIDKAVSALEAIRPQRLEVEVTTEDAQKPLDLTTPEEDDEAPATQHRKRKKKDPNRMHEGGQNREG